MGSSIRLRGTRATALVCFTGQTDIPWLKLLHKNYRHCFAVIRLEDRWIAYNPLSHRTDIQIFPEMPTGHLRRHLEESGLRVIECTTRTDTRFRLAPIFPYSCVEAVKRVLGLDARWIKTPRQLHIALREHLTNKLLDSPPPSCLYRQDSQATGPSRRLFHPQK